MGIFSPPAQTPYVPPSPALPPPPPTPVDKAAEDAAAQTKARLAAVFMSGYTEDTIIHQGRLDPAVLLLSKPFPKRALAQIVRQALDGAGSV